MYVCMYVCLLVVSQLVEQRTGNAEVTGSNPVEALIFFFFRLLLSNCLNWKIYCDDHSSLSLYVCTVRVVISVVNEMDVFSEVGVVDLVSRSL